LSTALPVFPVHGGRRLTAMRSPDRRSLQLGDDGLGASLHQPGQLRLADRFRTPPAAQSMAFAS
jgi:hypothetical protein